MQFKKSLMTATLVTIGGFAAMSSANADDTGSFNVNMTVKANCIVTAAPGDQDVAFGEVDAITTATTASSSAPIQVACSDTTVYQLALTPGNSTTAGAGIMTDTVSNDTIDYQLSASSAGPAWGSEDGSNTQTGTGTGLANTNDFTVYATASNTNVTPGTYSDLVNVTMIY